MIDARSLLGTHDVVFITLDTLRYDVAECALAAGWTPNLAACLPGGNWERRHTPGSFTFSAHQAFFAGFLPTPAAPGLHSRLFALAFPGSETTTESTLVFDAPDIVAGFAAADYRTSCVGGVGFFNRRSALGCVLPDLFSESVWSEDFGVTARESTRSQVDWALRRLDGMRPDERWFLFLNVSALHQPNCIFCPGATTDTADTQAHALRYVDEHIGRLLRALTSRAPLLVVICSDHGTAYGEDGFVGHRLAHPVVWTVPYTEFVANRGEFR